MSPDAQSWIEELKQYRAIARVLDGKPPITYEEFKQSLDRKGLWILAGTTALILTWSVILITMDKGPLPDPRPAITANQVDPAAAAKAFMDSVKPPKPLQPVSVNIRKVTTNTAIPTNYFRPRDQVTVKAAKATVNGQHITGR